VFTEVERVPLYLQIAEQLREAILQGRLAPGQPLPTERELEE
jgi:DNA-binding GntR family transcriptional regulator